MMKNIINLIKSPLRQECGKGTLQYGRLLPICAEDAPQFSNDVYNKRYTREKIASRFQQSGRSMIEMLGVLAIVGVLSVGGIAGYSKAMQRHLLNRQAEQISYILNAVETHYDELKISSMDGSTGGRDSIFITLGWIPPEMINQNSFYDVFKNRGRIYLWRSSPNHLGLYIDIKKRTLMNSVLICTK